MSELVADAPFAASGAPGRLTRFAAVLRRNKLEAVGLAIAVLAVVIVVIGPLLAPQDPDAPNFAAELQSPSWSHPFGTDTAGRDVLSRVLAGGRLTLLSVFAVIAFATIVGVVLGTLSALGPRWLDNLLMRICDVGLSFPALILALGLAASMGRGLTAAVVALALTWWPGYARLVRGLVLDVRELEYVESARALGVPRRRLITRHVLPNALDTLWVQTTFDVAAVTLVISGLSFIGVGAQIPQPEWGAMVADGRQVLTSAWWCVTFPGLAIALTAIGFNLVGDLLRSELDPTVHRRTSG
jgi:peptide/nickel transport system permease protein